MGNLAIFATFAAVADCCKLLIPHGNIKLANTNMKVGCLLFISRPVIYNMRSVLHTFMTSKSFFKLFYQAYNGEAV